jgi:hypothetical protein
MQEPWSENWRAVTPPGAARFDLPRRGSRLHLQEQVTRLPSGTPVAIRARGVGSSLRCKRFARRAGLAVAKCYLQLPSARAPAFLVETAPASLDYLMGAVATVPPGGATAAPVMDLGLRGLRRICKSRLFLALAPNLLMVGVRK